MPTFRDYMEAALYDPERGFYARRIPAEDFYTAPELHPAFGGAVARALARRLGELKTLGVPGPYTLVEMGSGSGLLARQILLSLKKEAPALAEETVYVLIERTREMLLSSMVSLSGAAEKLMGYARLEDLEPCRGIFFSNELVDAFPVHVLEKRGGEVLELYAGPNGATSPGPLSTPLLEPHAKAVASALQEGERHCVNLDMGPWLSAVCAKLEMGFLMTIDYGKRFAAGQINPPRTFFKHSTDDRLDENPGRKDITADVDFEQLRLEGEKRGLSLGFYGSLSRFLLDHGIEDWLPQGEDAASFKARAQIKTLLHPEAMGEVFKVMVQGKGVAAS